MTEETITLNARITQHAEAMLYEQHRHQRSMAFSRATMGGLGLFCFLSVLYKGWDADLMALFSYLFGLASIVPSLVDGPPLPPPPEIASMLPASTHRTLWSMYLAAWCMLGFWAIAIIWKLHRMMAR